LALLLEEVKCVERFEEFTRARKESRDTRNIILEMIYVLIN